MVATTPARNRVTPLGEIVAVAGRGAWMGNRGILHEGRGTRDIVRTSRNRAWIICALSFKDRRLPQWEPRRATQLFFLDEAVALAAGHRPCAECRRSDYNAYRTAWRDGLTGPIEDGELGRPSAKDLDHQLNQERRDRHTRKQLGHEVNWAELPDGGFVRLEAGPAVVVGDHLTVWTPENRYGERFRRPRLGRVTAITPRSSLAALRGGYRLQIDPAAL